MIMTTMVFSVSGQFKPPYKLYACKCMYMVLSVCVIVCVFCGFLVWFQSIATNQDATSTTLTALLQLQLLAFGDTRVRSCLLNLCASVKLQFSMVTVNDPLDFVTSMWQQNAFVAMTLVILFILFRPCFYCCGCCCSLYFVYIVGLA